MCACSCVYEKGLGRRAQGLGKDEEDECGVFLPYALNLGPYALTFSRIWYARTHVNTYARKLCACSFLFCKRGEIFFTSKYENNKDATCSSRPCGSKIFATSGNRPLFFTPNSTSSLAETRRARPILSRPFIFWPSSNRFAQRIGTTSSHTGLTALKFRVCS